MIEFYLDNDNLLSVTGLKNASSGSYMNDAVVTATLKDNAGTLVTGQTFPTTLSYMADTNGNYQATLQDTLNIIESTIYTAEITATSASGLVANWSMDLTATKRIA